MLISAFLKIVNTLQIESFLVLDWDNSVKYIMNFEKN